LFAMNQLREAPGLIVGQRVHRVEDDRLDTALIAIPRAVIQDRVKEALGLARAGAGGNQRWLWRISQAREPPVGAILMHIRPKALREPAEGRRPAIRNTAEGWPDADEGSTEDPFVVILARS